MKLFNTTLGLLLVLISCSTVPHTEQQEKVKNDTGDLYLGTKQSYTAPEKGIELPNGYDVQFVSLLARHGSRYMGGPDEDIALGNLFEDAKVNNGLTEEGVKLFNEINALKLLQAGNYGLLTPKGEREHLELGKRMHTLSPKFFDEATLMVGNATYKPRTQASRSFFEIGLNRKENIQWENHDFKKGQDPLLRYHKITPAYTAYLDSALWMPQIERELNSTAYLLLVDRIVRKYFTPAYLKAFKEEHKVFLDGEGKETIMSFSDIPLCIYDCYKISKAIALDIRPNFQNVFLDAELSQMEYIGDIEAFYEKGPGFKDRSASYINAIALLSKITLELETAINGKQNKQGYLNFAHAETTLPLVVLLDINNVQVHQNQLKKGSWKTSKWAAMANNIQWFVLEKEGEKYIHIRFNEQPATLPIQSIELGTYSWEAYKQYINKITQSVHMDYHNQEYRQMLQAL
ncbi:histidine-type phosphatase [Flammeovirga pectinis]|uniref:Multiple inositol polyphosphate phosphatase 1 n=1 Tax=Flammeovirga pectinis TaxID=2494373 RepID=A0A3S9P7H2_9BACT|nr:histidine-type phosphatase [Flammeovirga pectinis]AZQ64042.1 histidine-type phosphatase [Flammeovirga pectinis]